MVACPRGREQAHVRQAQHMGGRGRPSTRVARGGRGGAACMACLHSDGSGHTAAVLDRAAWHRVAWRAVTAVDHAMRQQTATGHLGRQSLWPARGGRLEPSNSTKRPFFSPVIFHFNHDAIQELKARATCCTAVPFTSSILHTEIHSRERTIASLS